MCLEKCFTSFLCYLIICDFFPGMTCDKANKQPDIIHHLSEQQEIELVAMFQQEWWTKGRTAEDTSRMLKHSYVVAMQDPESKKLIAFGRCVSDQVYKAVLQDIMVHKDHRRQGYGKQLIEQFRQHPELGDVAHFELYTKEEPFYVKLGFRTLNSRLHFMRWVRPGKFDPFRG